MDKNKNDGWPAEFKLFDPLERLRAVGRAVGDFLAKHHYEVETPLQGAERVLDEALDGEAVEPTQPQLW